MSPLLLSLYADSYRLAQASPPLGSEQPLQLGTTDCEVLRANGRNAGWTGSALVPLSAHPQVLLGAIVDHEVPHEEGIAKDRSPRP